MFYHLWHSVWGWANKYSSTRDTIFPVRGRADHINLKQPSSVSLGGCARGHEGRYLCSGSAQLTGERLSGNVSGLEELKHFPSSSLDCLCSVCCHERKTEIVLRQDSWKEGLALTRWKLHGGDLLGCHFNIELICKLKLYELSRRSSYEPNAVSVLGIIVWVVRGGHISNGVRIVDVDMAPTGCQETQLSQSTGWGKRTQSTAMII